MSTWQENVVPLTLKGGIKMPYTWSVGETGSRFLTALRDRQVLLANRCPQCDTTYVPPRKNCGRCFCDTDGDSWRELSGEGAVASFTVIHYASPVQAVEPPFALAVIDLDGADVGFMHLIKSNLDRLSHGARVRPVFKTDRSGVILDIECFELIEED